MRFALATMVLLAAPVLPGGAGRPAGPERTRAERIVALTLLGEARGEGELGMAAVAAVIQQRLLEAAAGDPAGICLAPRQFSVWNGRREAELAWLLDLPEAQAALRLARALVAGQPLDREATGYANHYHARWLKRKPAWTRNHRPTAVIGNHLFYRLP